MVETDGIHDSTSESELVLKQRATASRRLTEPTTNGTDASKKDLKQTNVII